MATAKRKFKWTAKRRAAFKKMRAGLARSRRVVVKRRVRHRNPRSINGKRQRRPTGAMPVRYNPLSAIIANPGRKPTTMARRKRRKARRVSRRRPTTRRRARRVRRAAPRRRVSRRRSPRRAAYKRRGVALYVNPRRRRARRRIRRRRNPSMGGTLRQVFTPFAVGFVTSMAAAGIDTFLSKSPRLAQLSKVGLAFVIGFAGRRHAAASCAAIGALGASIGQPIAIKMLGGMVATSPAQAVQGLGSMSRTYPQMGALLSGGMGALLSGMGDAPSNLPNTVSNYMTALQNTVNDDD